MMTYLSIRRNVVASAFIAVFLAAQVAGGASQSSAQPLATQEAVTDKVATAPPAPPKSLVPATALVNVTATPSDNGAVIHVEADGALQNYKSFTLTENPPRIVFDFAGIRSPSKDERHMAVKTGPVSQVRHLGYPDKVRLVIETQKPYLGSYTAKVVDNGLRILVGDAGAGFKDPGLRPASEAASTPPRQPTTPAAAAAEPPASKTGLAQAPGSVPAPESAAAKAAPPVINQPLGHRDDSQGNPGQGHRASAAEAAPAVRLSLLDAIRYSIEGNYDIRVVSFAPQQAQEELTSAKSVYDPSVFAEGSYRRQPDLTTSVDSIAMEDTGIAQTGVRQPLPTGGSLSAYLETRYEDFVNADVRRRYRNIFAPTIELRQPLLKNIGSQKEKTAIQVANLQATISEEEFRQKVIEIAARVSRAYWQLHMYRELVKIDRENLAMAEEVYRRETVRLSQGLSKQLDVQRARSNAQARRSSLLQSSQRLQVVMDQLRLLMNSSNLTIDSKTEVIPVEEPQIEPITVDEIKLIETALAGRPEVKKAAKEFEVRKAEEDLAAHQRFPNLDVFGRYGVSGYDRDFSGAVEDTKLNDDDAWAVGVSFEMPIGNDAAEALYRKKRLGRKQAKVQVERERDQVKLDVKQVVLAISYASGEIDSTRLAMEAAEKVVAGEFARFDIGQTTNEELLRAQDLLAGTSRNFIRAVVDYNIARAELWRAQGVLPEGVTIEASK
jgi:outer membrane protein